jgi:putative membrane protein
MSGLLMLVFFVALVVGVILIVRALLANQSRGSAWQSAPPSPSQGYEAPSALETLEQRYARGEIDRTEFLERKHGLTS